MSVRLCGMLGRGEHVSLTPNVLILRGTCSPLWHMPENVDCQRTLWADDFAIPGG